MYPVRRKKYFAFGVPRSPPEVPRRKASVFVILIL